MQKSHRTSTSELAVWLKKTREERDIRLEEVSSVTKIHVRNLELLERGEWDELPHEPFIRGFLTSYARHIGLDPNTVIERYIKERITEENQKSPESVQPELLQATTTHVENLPDTSQTKGNKQEPESSNKSKGPLIAAAVFAVVLVVVLTQSSLFQNIENPAPTEVTENNTVESQTPVDLAAPPPQEVASESLNAAPVVPENVGTGEADRTPSSVSEAVVTPENSASPLENIASPVATPSEAPVVTMPSINPDEVSKVTPNNVVIPPQSHNVAPVTIPYAIGYTPASVSKLEKAPHEITVEATERTWMKIVKDDTAPIQKFLNAGESITIEAQEKLKVVLGNSKSAKVTYNGMETTGKKFNGTIYSFIYPENARFPRDPVYRKKVFQADMAPIPTSEPVPESNKPETP